MRSPPHTDHLLPLPAPWMNARVKVDQSTAARGMMVQPVSQKKRSRKNRMAMTHPPMTSRTELDSTDQARDSNNFPSFKLRYKDVSL